jgi:hypothetical protein
MPGSTAMMTVFVAEALKDRHTHGEINDSEFQRQPGQPLRDRHNTANAASCLRPCGHSGL